MVSATLAIGDDVEDRLAWAKPQLALYIGGMGARGRNFYHNLATRYGFGEVADHIQDLYLAGKKAEAIDAVPDELVRHVSLVGPARVRQGTRRRLRRSRSDDAAGASADRRPPRIRALRRGAAGATVVASPATSVTRAKGYVSPKRGAACGTTFRTSSGMRNFTPMDATPDYSPTFGSSSAAISHRVSAAAAGSPSGAGSGGGGTGASVGAGSSGGGGSTGASAGSQVPRQPRHGFRDRFLGGRLLFRIDCGLDGLIVVFWLAIQFVVDVLVDRPAASISGVSANASSADPSRLPNASASCWPNPDRPLPTSGSPPSAGADGGAAIAGAVEPASTSGTGGGGGIGEGGGGAGVGIGADDAPHDGGATTGGAPALAAAGTVATSSSRGGGVHDGPRSPGTSNTASGSAVSSAVAASYKSITAAIAERIAVSQSARISLSTKGFTSLVDPFAGGRTVTCARRHSVRGGQPLVAAARSSAAIAAATFPSTACHRLSRSAANASAVVAHRRCRRRRCLAVPAQERTREVRAAALPRRGQRAELLVLAAVSASSVAATAASSAARSPPAPAGRGRPRCHTSRAPARRAASGPDSHSRAYGRPTHMSGCCRRRDAPPPAAMRHRTFRPSLPQSPGGAGIGFGVPIGGRTQCGGDLGGRARPLSELVHDVVDRRAQGVAASDVHATRDRPVEPNPVRCVRTAASTMSDAVSYWRATCVQRRHVDARDVRLSHTR